MNKLYRILCTILCICLILYSSPFVLAAEESGVIRISTLEEFLDFAESCRLDSFSQGKTFRLAADIDLTNADFDGIPIFSGTFEGGDHIISGLKITSSGSGKGLFRYLEPTATVRDLKVEGTVAPSGTRSQVGGIAGSNAGLIENCSFQGAVTGADYVGGIVGINLAGGLIRNCTTEGSIYGNHFSGGIAGANDGSIQSCTNRTDVNSTAKQNDITISDITLDNLINAESATATTDIGGICGISSGLILDCANYGSVGYPHMGYNVGGIAGLQTGYVAGCENYGTVSGRKEVGGIVGQQEPEVVLRYATDTLQILRAQIAVLSDLVDRAIANGNSNTTQIRNLLYKIERHALDAQEAADYLKDSVENPRFEDLQSYADSVKTIRDSILGISSTLRSLWDAMDETATDLNQDMKAISEQLAQVESTLNNADASLGGQIFDISDQDSTDQLSSKLDNCNNHGSVLGDLNVGGILGAVSFENDLDPEEDITVIGDTTLNAIGSLLSSILACTNTGEVTAKYQRVGGIVGWLTMGLVRDCVNTGAVGSDTVDYAGGIAGDSLGFIRNCKVKSTVRGDAHVGGIAGSGAIVSDCYAMVSMTGTEFAGGILGKEAESYHKLEAPIENNYYFMYGTDFGGIDGISYEDKAKGLTLEIFLLLLEDFEIFQQVTVTFLAEGAVVSQVKLPTGSAFSNVPDVPQKEGHIGIWGGLSDDDLDELIFDLTFHAEYTPYTTVIQSQETDSAGRPILLLQGDFEANESFTLDKLERYAGLAEGQKLLQGWEFSAQDCVELRAGRLLLPEGADPDKLILLVQDANGNWLQRTFQADESYLVFSLASGDNAIVLAEAKSGSLFSAEILIAAATGALAVLIIAWILHRTRKRKAKPASSGET